VLPQSIQTISVIVPENPFISSSLKSRRHCLCALDVENLMKWWPGKPHAPHRNANKVKSIQRALDWKRVSHIAAYLLQREIVDAPEKLDQFFGEIYEPKKNEPGREWPPKISKVIGYQPSEFPTFSNVLLHVNGAEIKKVRTPGKKGAANLIFDENSEELNFSVIDGQHRINGAYLAVKLRQEDDVSTKWEIPAEVFLDLDGRGAPPQHQAQIFIDVNFYQKKVDKSLVADLFPTARGPRKALDNKERAQDIGRKLMLEVGPLVGMIQIPGIKYGVKDVITLATLNGAVEDELEILYKNDIQSLDSQTEFIGQCLTAWFEATGRFEDPNASKRKALSPDNVVYQGRVLVSVLTLVPAMIWILWNKNISYLSTKAQSELIEQLEVIARNAGLMDRGIFIGKTEFKERGFLGSGGIARFRNILWAAVFRNNKIGDMTSEVIAKKAQENRDRVFKDLEI